MALTVGDLYKNSMKYSMKFLAGEEGLDNLVQWVHIIETNEGAGFLHGQEIVITEGVVVNDEEKLLTFIETLISLNASALIINTGMFINKVWKSAISYCDERGFPLFTIPWRVPLVDVTREFCQRIIDNTAREETVVAAFKNLLFHIGEETALISQMERNGYKKDSTIMFICISMEMEKGTEEYASKSNRIKYMIESTAKAIREEYISFAYQERRIVALFDYEESEVDTFIDRFFQKVAAADMQNCIYVGEGDYIKGIENQTANFVRASAACDIACKKQSHLLKYEELGLYKLLVNIEPKEVLSDFYQNTVGKVASYDEENGTDYMGFIEAYLACEGHQGEISEKLFIHRNTVNNYTRKVESIMGISLLTMEGRVKLYTAYCIKDLL